MIVPPGSPGAPAGPMTRPFYTRDTAAGQHFRAGRCSSHEADVSRCSYSGAVPERGRGAPRDERPPLPPRLNPRGRQVDRAGTHGHPRGLRLVRVLAAVLSFTILATSG